MNLKRLPLLLCLVFMLQLAAQEVKKRNDKIKLTDIPGYVTLKCDFHSHTVFSDGHVWPSFRVKEAQHDGLDVISITEHIDYEGYPDEVKRDRERAFEIAKEIADENDILLIKGAEISPRVPPFHNNALFLTNLNSIPFDYMKQSQKHFVMKDNITKEELMAPFLEVKRQGGFVFYNHPNYYKQYDWDKSKDKDLFTDFHKELLQKGILGGVEVVNSTRYNIEAHKIAEKYKLTMFANSDAHHEIASGYKGSHRPITLVFAKNKSVEAIEDAILDKRTMLYFENYLIGRQKEAEPFFKNAVFIEAIGQEFKNMPVIKLKISNKTDLDYEVKLKSKFLIQNLPLGKTVLKANDITTVMLGPVWDYPEEISLEMQVENILVSPEASLKTILDIPIDNVE